MATTARAGVVGVAAADTRTTQKLAALGVLLQMARANRRGPRLKPGIETRFAAALNNGATEQSLARLFKASPERIAGLCMRVIRAAA